MDLLRPPNPLPGRPTAMPVDGLHPVLGTPLQGPWPGLDRALFGMGCFWGAERMFWKLPGVHVTAVGYAGGVTPHPTYEEVCSGRTGHAEVVLVVFDAERCAFGDLLSAFWENHDPTQGMRQGNDVGTQYRSAVFTFGDAQAATATSSREAYQRRLLEAGKGTITTTLAEAPPFFYAEGYHQQYLWKNPNGYCGLGGTGVPCPVGAFASDSDNT